jgi:putative Mn2+ efflux pump MntP
MGIAEIILIGVSLSMDAFAVSVCSGLKMKRIDYKTAAVIALFFGGFQAIMPALGWALGQMFAAYVDKYDHYIAFALLTFIGGKMAWDALKDGGDGDEDYRIDLKSLFVMAIATSVDALAVGITFGMDPSVSILSAALIIGATTFAICMAGVVVGNIFGARWKNRAQIVGGVMLILVGLKILLEGLGIINLSI